jgi:high-affinity iron transporter
MFLNSVVLVLQEALEAALLISVLLVFSKHYQIKPRWVLVSIGLGSMGALIFALNMALVSEWFDYVGQEVINALIQFSILFLLGLLVLSLSINNPFIKPNTNVIKSNLWIMVCMILLVCLAITREGSEIFIYIGGVINQPSYAQPTLAGSGIGAGIGISAGVLIYYGLLGVTRNKVTAISLSLLSLVGGNMASQAVLLLTQADWLPYSQILWDSSAQIPENSVIGHLLYALIGYEATPSLFQFSAYLGGISLILIFWLLGKLIDVPSTMALDAENTGY